MTKQIRLSPEIRELGKKKTRTQVWKDYPVFSKKNNDNQQALLKMMNDEVKKPLKTKKNMFELELRSSWRDAVYFYPAGGFFMYNDRPIHFDIVFGLIEVGLLKFENIATHQGLKMPRYTLG